MGIYFTLKHQPRRELHGARIARGDVVAELCVHLLARGIEARRDIESVELRVVEGIVCR